MKIFLILITFLYNFLCAQTVSFQWAKQLGGPYTDYGNAIAVDAFGNVFTAGRFEGVADFDPGPGTFTLSGGDEVFVSKIDVSGNFVWAKQMGGNGLDWANSIAIDALGNIYTTGIFSDTADFDPGPGVFNLAAIACCGSNIFVSKLDASGNFVWAKQITGPNADEGLSIAVDASGNVYTTGYFAGTADFDPGAGTFTLSSLVGSEDVFISKLDALGNFLWAKQIGGISTDHGNSITVDAVGNVFTAGQFQGTPDFDPGPGVVLIPTFGGNDVFILKLDASGNFVWVKQLGGSLYEVPRFIFMDGLNNIYTTGNFIGTSDFDPGPGIFNLTSSGVQSFFISKLDALGNFVWAKQTGGTSATEVSSIFVDGAYNIYATGYFNGTVDFDPGIGIFNLSVLGNNDMFVSKLDPSGNFLWAKQMGGVINSVWGSAITVDGSNNVYTTGHFFSWGGNTTTDFDPGPGTYTMTASNHDVFVLKLSQGGVTGIIENNLDKTISIFPNPAINQINLVFNKTANNSFLKLINTTGQVVIEKTDLNENKIPIDISELANGIYILEIHEAENISRHKLIKN